jgi:tetratricopeptide (TPR) repeat protein
MKMQGRDVDFFHPWPEQQSFEMTFSYRSGGVVSTFLFTVVLFLPSVSESRLVFTYQQASPEVSAGQDDAFQRGLNALKENRLAAALEALTSAEQERPGDARVRNFRGIVLARLEQTSEAAAEYQEAIRLDPRLEDAYRNLGFLEWTEHQLDRARNTLKLAVELSPSDSFAHYYLSRVQLDARLYAEAFRELELSRVPWPADPNFLIEAATGYLALGKQEDARKMLNQLASSTLIDTHAAQVASLLLAVHENERAIEVLRKLSIRQTPGVAPWAHFDLALAYLLAGKYENSVEQARSYIDLLPATSSKPGEMAQAWSLIGIARARLNHAAMAVTALREAATLAPNLEEHWLNLSRELMELSRYTEAISAVQDGIASNPNSYALHLRLGAANMASGHYAEAETIFRALVMAGDPLPTSYIGLAQVLLRTGRAAESAAELATVRQKLGANFLISYFLGLSLDRAGKRLEATSAFEEAVQLNPSSSEAHLGLGKTELTLGRVSDATNELNEALRLNPGNVQVRRLLGQAYRRAGDTERAANFADAAAESPAPTGNDLLGDFVLPQWQASPESHKE